MKQLTENKNAMNDLIMDTKNELDVLNNDKLKHMQEISVAQKRIAGQCNELKVLIDSKQQQLEFELNKLKEVRLKEIETRKADLTSKLVAMQSFVQYSKELMEKGSMCDISGSANDLFLKSDQLLQAQRVLNKKRLYKYEVQFIPTSVTNISITLGGINFNGKPGQYIKN